MAFFVLVSGAASGPWYWHLLEASLRDRGHEAVAVELPCEDDSAGLSAYVDAVVDAIGDHEDAVVVAHSFGGFTGTLVAARHPVSALVLVQAMVPQGGEAPADWWAATGHAEAMRAQLERDGVSAEDPYAVFYPDVPRELADEVLRRDARDQSAAPMGAPVPLDGWPAVPTSFVLCTSDPFFPAEFLRGVVKNRLGIAPVEIDAGHHPMLSDPDRLAELLVATSDR